MSDAQGSGEGESRSLSARIDDACDRFEAAWKRGESPRIEDVLQEAPEEGRERLLVELIALEAAYRRRLQEKPTPHEYRQRFPEHSERIEAALALASDPHHGESIQGSVQGSVPDDGIQPTTIMPTLDSAASALTLAPTRPEEARAASQIGHFQLLKILGQGAFGTVYLAYDPRLDRKVAIKVPRTGVLADEDDYRRFLREARAAAQLRHPNIIPVYEVGQDYIAYEYVDGQTLRQVLKAERKFGHRRAAEMISKLAAALDYAHSLGIIHRDMKPENVLIDRAGQPHIADFGLARREEAETLETREGSILGTPAYMSPEQAAGQTHEIDRRSDVWSLGVMLEELLTGTRPFEGTITQLLQNVCHQEAKPLRQLDRTIPKDLETICQKCLAKKRQERYATARDLADDLDHWRRGEPIQARPIGPVGRAWRWAKRNPSIAAALAAVLVTLVVGTTVSTYFAIHARLEQRKRALAQVDALSSAAPESLPLILENLERDRGDVLPRLQARRQEQRLSQDQQARLAMAILALSSGPADQRLLAELQGRLLGAQPREFRVIRDFLKEPHSARLIAGLWTRAVQQEGDREARFRAACAVALFSQHDPRWEDLAADVTAMLLARNSLELADWIEALRPVGARLVPSLRATFESSRPADERTVAALVLARLVEDPGVLADLVHRADAGQLAVLLKELHRHSVSLAPLLEKDIERPPGSHDPAQPGAQRGIDQAVAQANAGVALLYLGQGRLVWPLLRSGKDPWVRTLILHQLGPADIDPEALISRLEAEQDPGILSALVLGLGEYRADQLSISRHKELAPRLLELYAGHPHSGVHSAVRWLLTTWGFGGELAKADERLKNAKPEGVQGWRVNSQGQTLAVIQGPLTFLMGSPEREVDRVTDVVDVERQHERTIPRSFAIGITEVTVAEYRRFAANHQYEKKYCPDPACPVLEVSWHEAARYCRWLSEQEGVPEDQMCFAPVNQIDPEEEPKLPKDVLQRTGYRLPTAAEWECAARAGAVTSRFYGDSDRLLEKHAWFEPNSENRSWPVGRLKPNDLGLFDVHGNALEWCLDCYFDEYPASSAGPVVDGADRRTGFLREIRGGGFLGLSQVIRLADRDSDVPARRSYEIGFRIARTIRDTSH